MGGGCRGRQDVGFCVQRTGERGAGRRGRCGTDWCPDREALATRPRRRIAGAAWTIIQRMGSRHLQVLIAAFASGLGGGAVDFVPEPGHLGFLDRIEAATTDLRTLTRGVRFPPDFVTIVAIDDAMVKRGGSYPLARTDLARIIDAIARLEPKVIAVDLLLVDRGTHDGDEALEKSLMGRASVLAAAAVFAQASQSIAAEKDE